QQIAIAEDYRYVGLDRLVFKMKVQNLTSLPKNGVWRMVFTVGSNSFYVSMNTDLNSVVFYEYGSVSGSTVSALGTPDEGSFTPDGQISISIANGKVGNPQSGTTLTAVSRSEEHTSELQSHLNLVCRLLLDKKKSKHPFQDT